MVRHRLGNWSHQQKIMAGGILFILICVGIYFAFASNKGVKVKVKHSRPLVKVVTLQRQDMMRHIDLSALQNPMAFNPDTISSLLNIWTLLYLVYASLLFSAAIAGLILLIVRRRHIRFEAESRELRRGERFVELGLLPVVRKSLYVANRDVNLRRFGEVCVQFELLRL